MLDQRHWWYRVLQKARKYFVIVEKLQLYLSFHNNVIRFLNDFLNLISDVFPVNFEGAKLMVSKGLSNHFQVSHTLNMSSVTPSGYRFGATYVGTKQLSPNEAYPVLFGDIDPSGNLNANILHQFGKHIRLKFVSQVCNYIDLK